MANLYSTTTGMKLTQPQINRRLIGVYRQMDLDAPVMCQACGKKKPLTHDHTISQKRCKELGRVELIYDEENIQFTCHDCHNEWESYKSGKFKSHKNYDRRMELLKICDREGYEKRFLV